MDKEKKESAQKIGMPEPTDGRRLYQVHGSGAIAEAFRQVQRRALRDGRGPEVVSALHQLRRRLQRNPTKLGEPLYRLAALRMQIRSVVLGPLVVDFGVCEDRPVVFIKGVTLLAKS